MARLSTASGAASSALAGDVGRTSADAIGAPQAALEGDPAAKAQVLAVNAMTPLELALACFQCSILARDS